MTEFDSLLPADSAEKAKTDASALRSTVVLSAGTFTSLLGGVVTAKVCAVVLGPSGHGQLALIQNAVSLVSLFAGCGLSVALIREGGPLELAGDRAEFRSLHRAARLGVIGAAMAATATLASVAGPLGRALLGVASEQLALVALGPICMLTMLTAVDMGALAAAQQVRLVATATAATAVVNTVTTVAIVTLLGLDGVALSVFVVAALDLGIAWSACRRAGHFQVKPSVSSWIASKRLFRFGLPYTASVIVGASTDVLLPPLVLHSLGVTAVGYFRAAFTISVGYLGFLLVALSQDFYPRVSAARSDHAAVNRLVNEECRLVILISTPLILLTLALSPLVVRIAFSERYTAATSLVEWMLLANLLRLPAWTLGYGVLSTGGRAFFFTELAGGVAFLALAMLGMNAGGIRGLGIAIAVAYAVYLVVAAIAMRRLYGFRFDSRTTRPLFVLTVVAAVVKATIDLTLPYARGAGVVVGLLTAVLCLRLLALDYPGVQTRVAAAFGRSDRRR